MIVSERGEPTKEEKIRDALSAAPRFIAETATVLDSDMKTVLREGSPDWICVPTPPGQPAPGPMCLDPTWMQFVQEVMQGKTPTIDRIGISYMLMGEAGADFDDVFATQPPEGKDWYRAGPHEMFCFPKGTGHILKGIGHDPSSGQPYVRPVRGAEPMLVVPVAKPGETACGCRSDCPCCRNNSATPDSESSA
ncbi:hypothetical protein AB0C28_08765 [Nonomuraea sp. NPDC048892]|uniref:hypothetical protein n=1 Tax=Nonomuraea sp. NPDC048892 TaxID=3154624 RepID=UPI00340449D0